MIQFALWNTCKNNCKFCFDQYNIKNDNKIENVKKIIDLLDKEEVKETDAISLIGGELFDTKFDDELRNLFYVLIDKIFLLKKKLFLMTNLIYDMDIELNPCIKHIINSGNINKTYICTSYDLTGRFHNQNSLELFQNNFDEMKKILTLHVEMVLSFSLLDAVVNNKFSLKDFFVRYTESVGFTPPFPGIDVNKTTTTFLQNFEFFPKRELYFRFLKKCFLEEKILDPNTFISRKYYSEIAYLLINGKYKEILKRNKFGNMPHDFHNYIDDDKHTMYEDFLSFKEAYGL